MRSLMAAAMIGALALATNANAQGEQGGQQGGQNQPQMGGGGVQMGNVGGPTSIAAVVKGTVTNLNLSRGTITVASSAGNVTLNALPSQIADLNPGDLVALHYLNYAGVRWLAINQGQGGAGVGGTGGNLSGLETNTFGQYGAVTGYISQLNKASGLITVRGIQFRTHPQFLASLLPGQFVTVNFAQVGNTNWAQNINANTSNPGQPTGMGGGAQGGFGGSGGGSRGGGGAQSGTSGGGGR